MSLVNFLSVNQRHVIHEIFDDEVVIVNLETGSYYSMAQVGTAIWRLLAQGIAEPDLVQSIVRQYQGSGSEIEECVRRFVAELQQESLIVSSSNAVPSNGSSANTSEQAKANGKVPFAAPVLNKYTDMEELLLLDPIHEVDDMGWPSVKNDPR